MDIFGISDDQHTVRFGVVNGDGKITGVVVLVVKETKVLQCTPLDALILIMVYEIIPTYIYIYNTVVFPSPIYPLANQLPSRGLKNSWLPSTNFEALKLSAVLEIMRNCWTTHRG